ncbi:hypothetical protein PG993_007154 [Apiospora rasikravindrae]|uniref:Uncharacterized protein n=1 Tax=Apiospora rasikravindrae TaxID=990691 RepID=A0ABR1SWQ3_9PEZI
MPSSSLSQVGGSCVKLRSDGGKRVKRLQQLEDWDSRKEHLKKWAGSVWRIGIEGSKNGDVIRKFRGASEESMGALPFGLGRFWGVYFGSQGPPRSAGASAWDRFSLHCSVRCFPPLAWALALAFGIGRPCSTSCTYYTTPYPSNCVAPAAGAERGWDSRSLSLILFLTGLHHPSSPLLASLKSQSHSFGGVTLNQDAKIQWRVPTATLASSTGAVPLPTYWGFSLGAADPGVVSHGRSTEYPNKNPRARNMACNFEVVVDRTRVWKAAALFGMYGILLHEGISSKLLRDGSDVH